MANNTSYAKRLERSQLDPRLTVVALAGTLAVALALRLWGLGRESLWLDEATSLMMARLSIPKLLAYTAVDIHPPLYYLLLHYWRYLGESEAVLRGLSVLGGTLGVGLIFLLGRELFGERAGLAAALLLAVSPLHIWYSQEMRGYVWLATFCILAMWGLGRWLRDVRRWWPGLAVYTLGATLAMYVHYYAGFAILAANVVVLLVVPCCLRCLGGSRTAPTRGGGGFPWRELLRTWGLWVAAQLAIVLLYLPWLPVFLRFSTGGGSGWVAVAGAPRPSALTATIVSFIVGSAQRYLPVLVRRPIYPLFMLALALGVGWGTWRGSDERSAQRRSAVVQAGLGFALPIGTAWLVSQIKPIYSGRYLLPFLPPFLVLVGRGATVFARRWQRLLAVALLLVGPLWATVEQVRHLDNPDWRGLAEQLAAAGRPSDVLVLMPGWNEKPLGYYLGGRVPIGEYVPDPIDPDHPEEALAVVRRTIASHERVWLLWAEGHYTDRTGVVAAFLDGQGRRVQTQDVPGVGVLILYELH